MLAGGAAAKVGTVDDNGILRLGLAGADEARGVRVEEANEGDSPSALLKATEEVLLRISDTIPFSLPPSQLPERD